MRHFISVAFAACIGLAVVGSAQMQSSLQGVWQITEVTDQAGTNDKPLPGIYIFTKTHYSIVEMQGQNGGPDAPAVDMVRSQSGTYEASNGSIRFRAIAARNPAAMSTGIQGTFALSNSSLTITTGKTVRKFRRLE